MMGKGRLTEGYRTGFARWGSLFDEGFQYFHAKIPQFVNWSRAPRDMSLEL